MLHQKLVLRHHDLAVIRSRPGATPHALPHDRVSSGPPPQVNLRLRGGSLLRSAQDCLSGQGFSLASRGRKILSDVGGSVLPGEIMALIGGTGAGKSSLVRASEAVGRTPAHSISRPAAKERSASSD